jgi:putative ABC transport system permease protein
MSTLILDVKYGLRQLRRSPTFTAVAIITLALGIGANTAIFSVIDAALLRPLPYDRPEQLVNLSTLRLNGNPMVIAPDFKVWQEQSRVFDGIGAFGVGFNGYSEGANLTGIGEPLRVTVIPVTAGFFHLLGVQPILGRDFSADEGQAGHNHVALLSASVWRQAFGGRRETLNKTIYLDGTSYTVVGVMPAGLLYPPGDLWVPEVLDASNSLPGSPDWPMLYVIGRLNPRVSLAQAQADLQIITRRLDAQFTAPGRRRNHSRWQVEIIPLRQLLAGDVRYFLLILLGAVGFVLLIACANLANLLLARSAARSKEIAVRSALGAGRFRLVRQFLAECTLLACFGGALGMLVGLGPERAMQELIPPNLPAQVTFDLRILTFVIVVSACAVILFGLVPALAATRVDVNEGLKEGGPQAGAGRVTHRLRSLLVIAEMALALVLLTGAGLLTRSFLRLTDVDLGFDPHHLLLADVWLPVAAINDPPRQANFFHDVVERLGALPGIERAAATTHYPVSIFNALATGLLVSGGPPPESDKPLSIAYISPDYFRAMRIRLLKGRCFDERDARKARAVAIVTESLARSALAGREPVGSEISLDGPKGPWRTVVGVVANTRNYLDREPWPEIFIPYQQDPSLFMTLVMRTTGDPMRLAASVRKAVWSVDSNEPIASTRTMDEIVEKAVAPQRFKMALLGSFALLALVLAAVGIFGVASYAVTERTHEIGIRLALGARREDVLRLVIGQGLRLTLVGVAAGVAGALVLTRFLSSLLYGVKPTDLLTFTAVSLILVGVAALASYIPARRATKVDPMVALRYE